MDPYITSIIAGVAGGTLLTLMVVFGAKPLMEKIKTFFPSKNPTTGYGTWLLNMFRLVASYLPVGVVLGGVYADIISEKFQYSIIGIAGVLATLIVNILGRWIGYSEPAATSTAQDAFEAFSSSVGLTELLTKCSNSSNYVGIFTSKFVPSEFVFGSTVLTYLLMNAGDYRQPSANIGVGLTTALAFVGIIINFWMGDCQKLYKVGWWSVPLAIGIGVLFGSLSYITVYYTAPSRLPFADAQGNPLPPSSVNSVGGTAGTAAAGASCSPPNDDDQLVCEPIA
jgi:hypothetical protein